MVKHPLLPSDNSNTLCSMRREREGEEEDAEEIKVREREREKGREWGDGQSREDRIDATFFAPDVCGRAAAAAILRGQPQLLVGVSTDLIDRRE